MDVPHQWLQPSHYRAEYEYDGRRSTKTPEERQERTRERNRNAQARYRQKQKEICEHIESQIRLAQSGKAQAEASRARLRDVRAQLLSRICSTLTTPSQQLKAHGNTCCPNSCSPAARAPSAALAASGTAVELLVAPVVTCKNTPEPVQQKSLIRTLHTSADLYISLDPLPPPISTFRCCAAIAYQDLLEASGSPAVIIDFSQMGFLDVVQAAQAATAQRLGYGQSHICWFLQSHYEVAPGTPLSFSTSLSSPECVASIVLHCMLCQVEVSILGLWDKPSCAAQHGSSRSAAEHASACMHSASLEPAMVKRARRRADCRTHGPDARSGGASASTVVVAEVAGGPGDRPNEGKSVGADGYADSGCGHEWARNGQSEISTGGCKVELGASFPQLVRCGVNGTFDTAAAVRAVVERVAGSVLRCSRGESEAAWGMIRACADRAMELVAQFSASGGTGGEQPGRDDARGRGGSHEAGSAGRDLQGQGSCGADGSAVDDCHQGAPDRQGVQGCAHATVHALSGDGAAAAAAESGGSRGECVTGGDAEAQCGAAACPEWHADDPAAGADGAPRQGRPGAASAGAAAEDRVAAYHEEVTRAVLGVLRAVTDVCYEMWETRPIDRAQAIRPDHGGEAAVAAPQEAGVGRTERMFVALTLLCAGHTLPLRDAGRVTRNIAFNSVVPMMLQCETENMHMRFFRQLQMSPEQCARMAACWHTWLARRQALNAAMDSAQELLDSLPQTLMIPMHHLSHIPLLAAGPLCANCARSQPEQASHMHSDCSSGDSCESPALMPKRGPACRASAPGLCHACGVAVDRRSEGGAGPREDEEAGMLGADHESTCRAAEALRWLWRMHDADGELGVSVIALHRQPGVMLNLRQLTHECQANLEQGKVDRLVMCQLAAAQVRRQELQRWPEVLTKPLPMRM